MSLFEAAGIRLTSRENDQTVDALIEGAGPAGLTAAICLAGFRRRIALINSGNSRGALIPDTHNYPGFPKDISGAELLARLLKQALHYGVRVRRGTVDALCRQSDGFFADACGERIAAKTVILATEVADKRPDIPHIRAAAVSGFPALVSDMRRCEVTDQNVAINRRANRAGRVDAGVADAVCSKDDLLPANAFATHGVAMRRSPSVCEPLPYQSIDGSPAQCLR